MVLYQKRVAHHTWVVMAIWLSTLGGKMLKQIGYYFSLTIGIIIAIPSVLILVVWALIQKPIPVNKDHLP